MLGNVLLCLFDEVEDSLLCGIFSMACSGWAGVDFSAGRSKTAGGALSDLSLSGRSEGDWDG